MADNSPARLPEELVAFADLLLRGTGLDARAAAAVARGNAPEGDSIDSQVVEALRAGWAASDHYDPALRRAARETPGAAGGAPSPDEVTPPR